MVSLLYWYPLAHITIRCICVWLQDILVLSYVTYCIQVYDGVCLCDSSLQLPQCLCIHLQRLTWSNEGTPIKRQEHVQISEYLSMDHYKHRATIQRLQVINCTPKTIKADNSGEAADKTPPNGKGTVKSLKLSSWN